MPGCSTSAARARRRWRASASRSCVNNLTFLPGFLLIPLGILGAAAFGAAWAAMPGYLQAKRGSHIVITTIMFNWLASVLIVYLLVNVLREPQSMNPETRAFPDQARDPVHARGLRAPSASRSRPRSSTSRSCWRWRRPISSGSSSTARASATRSASSARTRVRRSMPASRRRASPSSPWCSPARWPAASRSTSSWATSTACCSNSPPATASSASRWRSWGARIRSASSWPRSCSASSTRAARSSPSSSRPSPATWWW